LPEAAAQAAVADILEMNAMIEGTLAVLREQQDDSGARVVDVAAMLQALADDLAEQGQAVAMDGAPALHAKAHPAALKRILDNLVGNALRYGGSASLGVVAADGHVVVHVDDNGPGIPPGQLEQAFQPWTRLTTAHAGHGLGLAVARDLAERDGAQLTLHNRPEGGLRAQLALPRA
jgi:protein-histidine pros-kinase